MLCKDQEGGDAATTPRPCQLRPRCPNPLAPGPQWDRHRCPQLGCRRRSSSHFVVFPLKTKRLMPRSGRFLSQEHSPKTSAPGPALTNLTLCGPGSIGAKESWPPCPPPPAPHHSLTRGLTIDGPAGGAEEELTPALPPRRGCAGTRPRGGVGLLGKDPPAEFPGTANHP